MKTIIVGYRNHPGNGNRGILAGAGAGAGAIFLVVGFVVADVVADGRPIGMLVVVALVEVVVNSSTDGTAAKVPFVTRGTAVIAVTLLPFKAAVIDQIIEGASNVLLPLEPEMLLMLTVTVALG